MAGGLVALLDDVAALARMAAASADDVAAGVAKTTAKAAGVVIDDAAVTPQYVTGTSPASELPIIVKIARGSLVNKLFIITPLALLMSTFVPWLLTPLLMVGGTYLCYEGAHNIWGKLTGHEESDAGKVEVATTRGPEAEKSVVRSAIMTDLILSTEIMVISLNEVIDQPLLTRSLILIAVGIIITLTIYGVVALIVKMDDIGLHLVESDKAPQLGHILVTGMPKILTALTYIGTIAMLWVGGHILIVGADELRWHLPYVLAHGLGHLMGGVPGMGAVLQWLGETVVSMFIGFVWGSLLVWLMSLLPKKDAKTSH